MSNGGIGPLPFSARDFLGSSYYILSIVVILLALVGYMLNMKWRIDGLELREAEKPTKSDLATIAIKVEDRIKNLENRVEVLDVHGTRALADRTTLIEQGNKQQDERLQELVRRMNELQSSLNKLSGELPVIVDRQNANTAAVRDLQQRVWGGDRDRDRSPDRVPVGPIGPGWNAPPINQPQRPDRN